MDNLNKTALHNAWCMDTAYKGQTHRDNKSFGQCVPTALLVQDILGGELKGCFVGKARHFYNVIDHKIVDLTSDQFWPKDYTDGLLTVYNADRKKLLRNSHVARRYKLLKERYDKYNQES
jgi:hypothetical protein